jgi:pilus assembly protein CpaF
VQIARLSDGKRKVMSVSEITGMEGEVITMQDIFVFEQTGVGQDAAVQGHFRATGVRPKFLTRLKSFGVSVPDDLFDPTRALK